MCGIVGLSLRDETDDAAPLLVEALFQLQHRGQDASGISTAHLNCAAQCIKNNGLVGDAVASQLDSRSPGGPLGLGHVRYRTTGVSYSDPQPIFSKASHEIYFAHNGQVALNTRGRSDTNATILPKGTESSDSHFILSLLAQSLETRNPSRRSLASKTLASLKSVYDHCSGSFACIAMIDSRILVGFRDPHGLKPLILGRRVREGLFEYMIASESVALEKLDFDVLRDVAPGEAIFVDRSRPVNDRVRTKQIVPRKSWTPDIFEFVYFARPESTIDGISVQQCRKRMGRALGDTVTQRLGHAACQQIDVVVPVPESGNVCALALSYQLGIPMDFGIVKNAYSTRTFILPNAAQRLKGVSRKLSVVKSVFAGKNVLIVDDSIVRGGTSREIVRMARRAGAKNVIFVSGSPAIKFNHIHGIDLAAPQALIAHGRSDDEVAEAIGADHVVYLPLGDLYECCLDSAFARSRVDGFEVGMFTGKYVTD